jgi:oligoribonuclease (3'-5' exoribonuclease)
MSQPAHAVSDLLHYRNVDVSKFDPYADPRPF